jgi:penicillin-binding protein 2
MKALLAVPLTLAMWLGMSPLLDAATKVPASRHAAKKTRSKAARKAAPKAAKVSVKAPARKTPAAKPAAAPKVRTAGRRKLRIMRPLVPLPFVDPTDGDNVDGEDLQVRRAAVAALGNVNGAIVVVDPQTGRVLSMVNQRLALTGAFIPCSTIKLVTSLAALSEGVVERETPVRLGRRYSLRMTDAIAHSNNPYFSALGKQLGFERVNRYAKMLGLGEKAGLDIDGELPGGVPAVPPPGGVGLMTAFGEGFQVTPLELASLLSTIANHGTMYYLQYPRSPEEIEGFTPKVKREIEVAPNGIEDIKIGMRAAVNIGTARRAGYDQSEPIFGKTGTCTDFPTSHHMGWFGSFNEVDRNRLVVVVMLATSNKSVSGPVAAGVAGAVYRNLSEQRYFTSSDSASVTPQLVGNGSCCSR